MNEEERKTEERLSFEEILFRRINEISYELGHIEKFKKINLSGNVFSKIYNFYNMIKFILNEKEKEEIESLIEKLISYNVYYRDLDTLREYYENNVNIDFIIELEKSKKYKILKIEQSDGRVADKIIFQVSLEMFSKILEFLNEKGLLLRFERKERVKYE